MRARLGVVLVVGAFLVSAATAPAGAATTEDQWSMSVVDGSSPNRVGGPVMSFYGSWRQVTGVMGGAVEFTAAPSFGVATGTEDQNPGSSSFAVAETFTSKSIPTGVGYSGNLMQKGYFDDHGQVKMQLVPYSGGTVSCRIKGTNGARTLHSAVVVDDGTWHTTSCWRDGSQVGLTVDGVSRSTTWNPGSIANLRPVRLGNKSSTADWTDQHLGKVDCAAYVLGDGARDQALSLVPC